ncbi:MAG: hypothetical protein ACRC16_22060 [Aeromonas salmonicida]
MFHSLFNTVRRTRTLVVDWLPGESQLHLTLTRLHDQLEPFTSLNPDTPELSPMAADCRATLEMVASYIRSMHDLLPSPVPAPAVLSIATLIQQDLDVIDSVYSDS